MLAKRIPYTFIIGVFFIIPSLELAFRSDAFSLWHLGSLFTACFGFILCCHGGVKVVQQLRRNADSEAIAVAASISNTIAFFLLAVFSIVIAIIAINPTSENNSVIQGQDMARLAIYSVGIVLTALVALIFWVVFTIIGRGNEKHQLSFIDHRNVLHIVSREEKERTLRALLAESKRVIAYIDDAQAFFSEFIVGQLKLVSESITLVCPPEVCCQVFDEYKKRIKTDDLPDDIVFIAEIPKFTQSVSALFFFEASGDSTPKRAILMSLHGIEQPMSDNGKGDAKWFVFSNKDGIAEHVYACYDRIERTPPICIMRKFDHPKQDNSKAFVRSVCKYRSEKDADRKNGNGECSCEGRDLMWNCQSQKREYLDIDWIIESARILQKDFDRRWKLIREMQYLDFSERTETNWRMEEFTETLQSLHAFDETDLTAWVQTGRLKTFLQKIKEKIGTISGDVCRQKDASGPLPADHLNFFGRVFILKSREFLFEPYKGTKLFNGDMLVEVLNFHKSPDEGGIIQTGVIYEEDIKKDRANSWIIDFAVYNRTVTWCEKLKGFGASNSIGGFSTNRELVESNLQKFTQVWESQFPSCCCLGPDGEIKLFASGLSGEASMQVSRTPLEEAEMIVNHWNDIRELGKQHEIEK